MENSKQNYEFISKIIIYIMSFSVLFENFIQGFQMLILLSSLRISILALVDIWDKFLTINFLTKLKSYAIFTWNIKKIMQTKMGLPVFLFEINYKISLRSFFFFE